MSADFTPEQKRYLEGFLSGVQATRTVQATPLPDMATAPSGPDAPHLAAQAATEAQGGKLVDQEKWKRDEHPFDAYPRFKAQAEAGHFPKPPDNFRWRYYGLFYVAPAQNSYMCRLRIPNGILNHWQFSGLADVADRFGNGHLDVTTRANLQFREIKAENAVQVVEAIQDLGLCSRGSGADNIRNVTGDATAGIAAQELIDTRPYARAWHFHILNERVLTGLPRKFNVAFDGGGPIATLEDTNDVGFQAVEVLPDGGVEPGVYFRLILGGISGHRDLARDTGVILPLADSIRVADAIVRVFIDHGDRTNRAKSRLKYVLDAWGFDKFLAAVEEKLGSQLLRIAPAFVAARPVQDRLAHIGVHPQKQAGLNYVGVVLPVGRLTTAQVRTISELASTHGDGQIRLTVWQNLLLSGIPTDKVAEVRNHIQACGLDTQASHVRAGLVACTGSRGCKFAAADTKGQAQEIATWCDARVQLDVPINIHITGCHHSCAQHYIGDVGLIGARVTTNDEGDTVDGFDVVVGGGYSAQAAIAKDLAKGIKATEAPQFVEHLLKAYMAHRQTADESFFAFTQRTPVEDLLQMTREVAA